MLAGASASTLAPELQTALERLGRGLQLRVETPADQEFLVALYTSTRWQELAPVDWPDAAKIEFLAQQARQQHAHYLAHYAGAERLLISAPSTSSADNAAIQSEWVDPGTLNRRLIGRIYLQSSTSEIRLMDIALLPVHRGCGIGACLVQALQSQAASHARELTLHVEPNNPAQRLYQRLGFQLIEHRGVYDFLGWKHPAPKLD